MQKNNHVWQFSKIGGVSRVNLESGNDLLHLDKLDQKLWTALSCPVSGLEIDPKTLELIDKDKDGKIRVPEILEAVKWITSLVRNPDCLVRKNAHMSLSEINTETELGKTLYASSKQILTNIGKADSDMLTVEETMDSTAIFANTVFNGDGIITADSTDDDGLKTLIAQIIQCEGSLIDRSGKEGLDTALTDAFYTHCEEYSNWIGQSESDGANILPFGESTEEAFAAFSAVKSKIDDYFLRCQLAEFDPLSVDTLNSVIARIESINAKELPTCIDEISNFPLLKIESNKPLSFSTGINPAWRSQLLKFQEMVFPSSENIKPEMDEKEWKLLSDKFNAFQNWKLQEAGIEVEVLGMETIRTILDENRKEEILTLIAEDNKLIEETNNIILVEQMVRYHRDLFTLLNNFVTFSDFYRPDARAIFQAGKLYFDQRNCDLCIKVSDMAKHNSMAASSGICLVYLNCSSKVKDEKMTIVAAFTDGDVDNMVVGRNAIFYDNDGNDWDATIIKIIDNPISIRQAFWSPYRKFSQFISKQIEKFATTRENQVQSNATSNAEKASKQLASSDPDAAKPLPFDIGKFVGIFAAIALALGAIGGVLATVAKGFFALTWWKMPLAFLGIILIISVPSMILAWLKLRKRNLAPVLDANGWAINARATINIAFGTTLTHLAKLPKNSKQNFVDPYQAKRNPWLTFFIVLVVIVGIVYLLLRFGLLQKWGITGAPIPLGSKSM